MTLAIRLIVDRRGSADTCRFPADGWRQQGDEARAEAYAALEAHYLKPTTS